MEENGEKAYNEAKDIYEEYKDIKNGFNNMVSNLSTNASSIRYYGPMELQNSAKAFSSRANFVYFSSLISDAVLDSYINREFVPSNQRKMAEDFGGFVGASVGGFVAGTAMAGFFQRQV